MRRRPGVITQPAVGDASLQRWTHRPTRRGSVQPSPPFAPRDPTSGTGFLGSESTDVVDSDPKIGASAGAFDGDDRDRSVEALELTPARRDEHQVLGAGVRLDGAGHPFRRSQHLTRLTTGP